MRGGKIKCITFALFLQHESPYLLKYIQVRMIISSFVIIQLTRLVPKIMLLVRYMFMYFKMYEVYDECMKYMMYFKMMGTFPLLHQF